MKNKSVFTSLLLLITPVFFFAFMFPGEVSPKKGVDMKSLDLTQDPRNNLYEYANGSWLKNNPIPASEASWGAFNELAEKNRKLLKTIIEEAALDAKAPAGSIKQKVGDYYSIAMDTVKLEKEGMKPIEADLKKIDALKNMDEFMMLVASFHSVGMSPLFGIGIFQDLKKSDEYITYVSQGGLGLPDRDYYLKDDEESKKIRDAYVKHVARMFELGGKKESAPKSASTVMNIETELAKSSMTNVELRDDEKQYHKFVVQDMKTNYPASNWVVYFKEFGISGIPALIVTQPDFFKRVDELFKSVPLADWKTYLTWCLLNESADKLSAVFEKQNFSFFGTTLQGTKEMRPRWKRMIGSTNTALGEAVGQLYVEKAFSPESKKRVNEMVDNLLAAYKVRIENLPWMSAETKKHALTKLASFNRKLGYPDKWKDYSTLLINRESFYKNYYNAQHFEVARMIAKLGKPVDKTEWGMSPQTVNAYYNPLVNDINFPAAIMQPPFFNPDADDAVNYGAMGSVIGHEITHGFDDQGSKYDEHGNLNDWWTKEDRDRFNERTKKLVAQFNAYPVADKLNVNGELTLGENIADLGGLTMAYEAYQKSVQGKAPVIIDKFTPEQRFFLGWAQVWRTNYRPEALRQQVLTNVHSPDNFRSIGAPSNLEVFYKAFNVKEGDKMYRNENERVVIW